ncbi:hypothetical protein KAU19_01145 [Candidatus Parcubacteria bacterium]|nr:hypothetical protein [Candidatus Parcubacteria bacterium]
MKYFYSISRIVILLLYFVTVGLVVIAATTNYVQAGVGLSIQPIKISHTIEPGQSVSGKITVTNASNEPVNVDVKIEDFIPMAGTITIQFVGRTEGVTTVRDWITLEPSGSFVLQEKQSRIVRYTIKAPFDAEPGGHFGVTFFKATKLAEAEGKQLKVGTQIGMLIFVTVPGNSLQKGKILDFSAPRFIQKGLVPFTIQFETTGTVHFEPKGAIKITNILGKEAGEIPVQGQVVLPTGVRDLTAQWNENKFLLGRYKATLSMTDGEGNELTADSIIFYAFPMWYVSGFILAIIILFFVFKFLRSKLKISVSLKK